MTAAFILVGAVCFLAGNASYAALDWWAERSVLRRNRADLRLVLGKRK